MSHKSSASVEESSKPSWGMWSRFNCAGWFYVAEVLRAGESVAVQTGIGAKLISPGLISRLGEAEKQFDRKRSEMSRSAAPPYAQEVRQPA